MKKMVSFYHRLGCPGLMVVEVHVLGQQLSELDRLSCDRNKMLLQFKSNLKTRQIDERNQRGLSPRQERPAASG
jgi:hypothetical protein